jgi:hypothetical protein
MMPNELFITTALCSDSHIHDVLVDDGNIESNPLTVHGEIDTALLAREIEIGLSPAGAATRPGRWKSWKSTVGGLLGIVTKHQVGDKDGNCFLQGATIGGERRSNSIPHMDLLVLDLDTGESVDEIVAKLRQLNLFAVVYTTHSHLKPITDVKKDDVIKWIGADVANPTVDDVKSYLINKKRYQEWVLEGAELLETQHTAEGIKMFIRHQPMPKFRIVLVLKDRFVFMNRAATQQAAITEWKERYAGASKLLGAFFDRSCTDPSRLFYTPRHPQSAGEWRVEVIAGRPLDIETVDRVTQEELKRGQPVRLRQRPAPCMATSRITRRTISCGSSKSMGTASTLRPSFWRSTQRVTEEIGLAVLGATTDARTMMPIPMPAMSTM